MTADRAPGTHLDIHRVRPRSAAPARRLPGDRVHASATSLNEQQ
ncbi:hypothetical protein ACFRMN_15805 [Streptomyces sp. NPDC056835]